MEIDESKWIQDLSLQLFKVIRNHSGKENSLVISPVCILSCLTMLLAGSDGSTKQDLLSSPLFKDRRDDEASIYNDVMELISSMRHDKQRKSLTSTAKLFVHGGVEVAGTFRAAANRIFQEEIIQKIDFGGNTSVAVDSMNAWIGEATSGRILDLISPTSVTEETALVAVSLVAFKESWETKFENFRISDFHGLNRVSRDVTFMHRQGLFRATTDEPGTEPAAVQVLELPYADDNFVLDVFLPPFGSNPDDFVSNSLSSEFVRNCIERLSPRHVDVMLPRFRTRNSLDLKSVLETFGAGKLFSERECDLSRITGGSSRDLFVSRVVHSSFLSVDEEGTEASAATAASGRTRRSTDVQYFHADRPFVLILRNLISHSFLFVGLVSDLPIETSSTQSQPTTTITQQPATTINSSKNNEL